MAAAPPRRAARREFAEHGWDTDDVPEPAGPADVRALQVGLDRTRRATAGSVLACYRDLIALRAARPEFTDPWLTDLRVDYDEEQRWIVLHRGDLRVACNLAAEPATVPVGGTPVLWWEPVTSDATASATLVPGHSFVVLELA